MTTNRPVLCLALGETIVWAGLYYHFPALLLQWEAAEGWSKTALTAAFAAAVAVSALVSPVVGRLIDRGHGPRVLAGSAAAGAALLALLPLASGIWPFAALWLCLGVAMGGCLYEPCFALVTRARGADARRAITVITLFAGFAGTLAFPVGHWLSSSAGWHVATWTFAGLVGVVAVPLLWVGATSLEREAREHASIPQSDTAGAAPPRPPKPRILRKPAFWLLAGGFAMLGTDHGVIVNHILPILHDRGVPGGLAVLAASMIGPMQVAGRLAIMAGERRLSSRAVTTASFGFVFTAAICLYAAIAWPVLLVPFVVLQGSGYGVLSIMRPVMTRELLGQRNFGAISGAMAVPYMTSYAVSPFLGSLVWQAGGYPLVIVVVGALSVIGLVSFRLALRTASPGGLQARKGLVSIG